MVKLAILASFSSTNTWAVAPRFRFPQSSFSLQLQFAQAYLRLSRTIHPFPLIRGPIKPPAGPSSIISLLVGIGFRPTANTRPVFGTKTFLLSAFVSSHPTTMPAKTTRIATAFTAAEDSLIIALKDRGDLTWKDIAIEFAKKFPTKTHGALQVRYTRALDPRKFGTKKPANGSGIKKNNKDTHTTKKQTTRGAVVKNKKKQKPTKVRVRASSSPEVEAPIGGMKLRSGGSTAAGGSVKGEAWKKLRFNLKTETLISAEDAARILVSMSAGR